MISFEVNSMENEHEFENQTPETEGYTPRPAWQVWGARIVLVIFIFLLIAYYSNIFTGGM